jgi:tripartite ATP-independent transporter DctM subunit
MSLGMITLLIWVALLLLLATGFPVAFCMVSVAVVGFLVFVGPHALFTIYPTIFGTLTKDVFVAIPLFVFMAAMLEISGIGSRMYEMMYKWMSGLKGGLAIGTVLICAVIAAMTGLSGTGTIIMGILAYPEMRKRGYDKELAAGSIMAGGCLGPLIPPSLPMIIVGALAGISVGKLFMAGVLPGLICTLIFVVYIGIRCLHNPGLGPPIPLVERANWREKFASLAGVIAPIFLILLVLGGIYTGVCTPTEAGGVGAVGALICSAIYRNLTWKNLYSALITSLRITSMNLWIVLGGAAFTSLCGITGVNRFVGVNITGLELPPTGILCLMLFIIFILGMFMDSAAIMMITVPVFAPIAVAMGIDLLWFGFLLSLDVIIGMLTPPFGYSLFYFKGIGHKGVSMADIYHAAFPFVPLMVIVLALCILFPEIPLWLPRMMIK